MKVNNLDILIIDDHRIMRSFIEKNLDTINQKKVKFAVDGVDALEKIGQENFNLILADWNMPNMSGLELLNIIRTEERYDNVAYVMVTAESDKSKIIDAMAAGATSYLEKPFTEAEFQRTIEKVIIWLDKKMKSRRLL